MVLETEERLQEWVRLELVLEVNHAAKTSGKKHPYGEPEAEPVVDIYPPSEF